MNKELYERLIHLHQDEVNKQRYIEITNVHTDLFDTLVNFSKHPQSVPVTVKKFLQGLGKVLAIEPTIDTEESGTYQLITNNKDHDIAIKKLGELQLHLTKEKGKIPTIISSFESVGSYPEVNGRPPIGDSMSDQVERLESQVKELFVPPQKNTTYNLPVRSSVWDLPMDITTTTAQSPAPTTPKTYKSAVQNQTIMTTQPKSNQNRTVATTSSPQQRQ